MHVSAQISSFLSLSVWYQTFPTFFSQTATFVLIVFTPTPDKVYFAGYGTVWCQQLDLHASTERADGLRYGSNTMPQALIRHTPSGTQLFDNGTVYKSILFRRFELGKPIQFWNAYFPPKVSLRAEFKPFKKVNWKYKPRGGISRRVCCEFAGKSQFLHYFQHCNPDWLTVSVSFHSFWCFRQNVIMAIGTENSCWFVSRSSSPGPK